MRHLDIGDKPHELIQVKDSNEFRGEINWATLILASGLILFFGSILGAFWLPCIDMTIYERLLCSTAYIGFMLLIGVHAESEVSNND
jgi:hypothetical protein